MQDVVTVEPSTDLEAQTFINGTAITSSTVLHHVRSITLWYSRF